VICPPCRASLHKSCMGCDCKHGITTDATQDAITPHVPVEQVEEEEVNERLAPSKRQRSLKRDATLKDQQSTGRKRAARMYPLSPDAPCEWRGQGEVGGGNHPIVGCVSGVQEARHHGPDKSTSNNEEGNVHRICHRCHNRWHAANNEDYDWNSTLVNSHSPRPQTDDERQQAILDELVYHGSKQTPVRD
jgi:hypothetical protein